MAARLLSEKLCVASSTELSMQLSTSFGSRVLMAQTGT